MKLKFKMSGKPDEIKKSIKPGLQKVASMMQSDSDNQQPKKKLRFKK